MDKGEVTALTLLHRSASFDTIDVNDLFKRISGYSFAPAFHLIVHALHFKEGLYKITFPMHYLFVDQFYSLCIIYFSAL